MSLILLSLLFISCVKNDNNSNSNNGAKSLIESSKPLHAEVVANENISELCNVFIGIRNETAESGVNLDSAENWQKRILWTENILQAAPKRFENAAKIYLQLVQDRENLVSQYDYVNVRQLPSDIRMKFIQEHQKSQLISNTLIEFATQNCFESE
jgi:hypothetical protein